MEKGVYRRANLLSLLKVLAEREGFEPPVELPLRLISSQVHSTTLPPLRGVQSELVLALRV